MGTARAAGLIFGFGILVLVVGLFVAPLSSAPNQDASANLILADGESAEPHTNLEVTANAASGDNVTVVLTDLRYADRVNTTLQPSQSDTVQLNGQNVTVTYLQRLASEYGINVEYPPTFSYNDGVATFWNNLPLLLSIVGLVFCLSGLIMAVRLA